MPNWSNTKISLKGNTRVIERLEKKIKKNGFETDIKITEPRIFEKYGNLGCAMNRMRTRKTFLVPGKQKNRKVGRSGLRSSGRKMRAILRHKEDTRTWESWYVWRMCNWGVKWNLDFETLDIEVVKINAETSELKMDFSSAWSGPNLWVEHIAKKYKLSGTYSDIESGNDFFYLLTFEDGKIVSSADTEYLSKEAIAHLGADYFYGQGDFHLEDEATVIRWGDGEKNIITTYLELGIMEEKEVKDALKYFKEEAKKA